MTFLSAWQSLLAILSSYARCSNLSRGRQISTFRERSASTSSRTAHVRESEQVRRSKLTFERTRSRVSKHRDLLVAALGFVQVPPETPALRMLHRWLNTWRGICDIAAGTHRQGYDLQLTEYDERGWRATFYASGMEHSATTVIGSGFEPSPCTA